MLPCSSALWSSCSAASALGRPKFSVAPAYGNSLAIGHCGACLLRALPLHRLAASALGHFGARFAQRSAAQVLWAALVRSCSVLGCFGAPPLQRSATHKTAASTALGVSPELGHCGTQRLRRSATLACGAAPALRHSCWSSACRTLGLSKGLTHGGFGARPLRSQ